jgi:hypothetical protein
MNMPALLVRLYPPAIRQRWGADIARDVELSGPRSWFDTVAGATKLWLHPSDWPETTVGQTRRVVATVLVVVAMMVAMLLRAVDPDPLASNVSHSAWLAPILVGLALSAPLLPWRGAVFGRLAAVVARTLVAPGLALAVLFLLAHSGVIDHPVGAMHLLLLGYYWATLGFVGIHLCLFMERIGRITITPSTRRLHLALLVFGVGLAFGAAQSLTVSLRSSLHIGLMVQSCGLAALAAVVLVVGLDLRRNLTDGSPPSAGRPTR